MATPLVFSHFTHFPRILGYLHDLGNPQLSPGRDQAEEDQGGPFSAHACGAVAESAAGSDPGVAQMGSLFGN